MFFGSNLTLLFFILLEAVLKLHILENFRWQSKSFRGNFFVNFSEL